MQALNRPRIHRCSRNSRPPCEGSWKGSSRKCLTRSHGKTWGASSCIRAIRPMQHARYNKLCEPGEKRRANERGQDRREDCQVFLRVWMFQSGGKDTLYSRPQSVRLELYIFTAEKLRLAFSANIPWKKKKECVQSAHNVRRRPRETAECQTFVSLCFSFFYSRCVVINESRSWNVKSHV